MERKNSSFLSSTFRDINEELDSLNNIIFPQIRDYCEQRFGKFMPVGLQLGVMEEESRNGLVLASCMEEIYISHLFFVVIIGHRYGWMPTEAESTSSNY